MSPVVPDSATHREASAAIPAATTSKPRVEQAATPMFVPMTDNATTHGAPATVAPPVAAPKIQTQQPAAPMFAPATPAPELPVTEKITDDPGDTNLRYAVATRHLLDAVPNDIEPYFDLFLYVSKAGNGPLAQRMFVFQRDTDGHIVPYAEWRVSTGREKLEIHNDRKIRTVTPDGIFMLDPNRFYRHYWSHSWDNAPMHYAMFYDMLTNGAHSGIAIHAAIGQSKIERLGQRDSAGCIRLAPRNAKELFYKVQNTTRGAVPVLAVNERHSTDRWGKAERNEAGAMMMQDGYRALLYVENFDGNQETVGPVVAYTH